MVVYALMEWEIYNAARGMLIFITFLIIMMNLFRYANMDYIMLASIAGINMPYLSISYDIACQWSKNLRDRVSRFPSAMQSAFILSETVRFFVPKFHLSAHGENCQGPFSYNWMKDVGRTDGEGIERSWSMVNVLATMLREMGPGFRHDTFDNHWSALNWRKITGLGTYSLILACRVLRKYR